MKTECVHKVDLNGPFSLILYSGPWPEGIGNVAFLDREDDRITLEPYAPAFAFTVLHGLSANEALARAKYFVSRHSSFCGSQLERIIDDYDRVVGYEVCPLYLQTTFGSKDILTVSYRQRDNHIDIFVRLNSNIEQIL